MTIPRIRLETRDVDFTVDTSIDGVERSRIDLDAYSEAVNAEIIAKARGFLADDPRDTVKLEVQYPDETTEQWAATGDAVAVDFSFDPPRITTLPPYDEVVP